VIGDQDTKPTGKDKTSLLVSVKNRVGALTGLIAPLATKKIDLTKIESRPSRKRAWDYVFFIDLIGHVDDPDLVEALDQIAENCSELKLLGSYPQGDVES
jgi:chorismate mutase/prephenate dehydratase